jgi:GDP-4-dehydro-6-deoxy-D-mannose reductase
VLPSIARQLVKMGRGEAEPVLKVGNLDVRRDFLDVRDVVRAYVWLM